MSNYSDLARSTARSQPLTTMRAQVERMDDTKKASRKAKILIAFGLILPIVAGVIGVVAWAVNAGTVLGTNKINMPFKSTQVNNKLVGIGQRPFLENRMDSRFGPNPTLIKRPDKLTSLDLESDRVKTAINDFSNSTPEQEAFSSSIGQSKGKKDDVFFVQYMNNGKKKDDSTTESTSIENPDLNGDPPARLSMNDESDVTDLLTRIIEASKDKNKNSPQTVVFTPPDKKKIEKLANSKSTSSGLSQNSNDNVQFDDDDSDDVTNKKRPLVKDLEALDATISRTLGPKRSGEQPFVPDEQSKAHDDRSYSRESQHSYGGYAPPPYSPPSTYSSDSYKAPAPSYYPPEPPKVDYNSYGGYNGDYHESGYHDEYHESGGHSEYPPSKGISIHIDGGKGYGGYSPVGSLTSLLLPSLGKPKVNLNGRVVFGVVLDKGIGLGGNTHHGSGYNR